MSERNVKKGSKTKKTNAATRSSRRTSADLKPRFKSGSIPLESDFTDLIDLANTGVRAAGQDSDQNGPGYGLEIKDTGELAVDVNAILPEAGYGLEIKDTGELAVDLAAILPAILPAGMIMMFSGTTIPDGWALCDGSNGTPNLVDRFIMGGKVADVGGKSTEVFSGAKDSKAFSFESEDTTVFVQGTTAGHSLTAEENGPHSHWVGVMVPESKYCLYDNRIHHEGTDYLKQSWWAPDAAEPRTQPDGDGKAHSHNVSITSQAHSHDNNVTTPYYILAFIIKK